MNASTGEFDHLIAAVVRGGLVDLLNGHRQLTVFAPTDAAFEHLFAALGVSGVDHIPVATLRAVLLHHIAPGDRSSGEVLGSTRIPRMLDHSFTHPAVVGGVPTIDGATIVASRVKVSDGVIHVIDAAAASLTVPRGKSGPADHDGPPGRSLSWGNAVWKLRFRGPG